MLRNSLQIKVEPHYFSSCSLLALLHVNANKNSMAWPTRDKSIIQFRAPTGGGWFVVARDHLIPHFEPRAFENFAALEPSLPPSLTPSSPPSFIHPGRTSAGRRQILVESGAGPDSSGGRDEGGGRGRQAGISKVCQVSLKTGKLSLSLSLTTATTPLTCGGGQTSFFAALE